MKIMLIESKNACQIHSTIHGLVDHFDYSRERLDIAEHIQNILAGVGEECLFDRSLYGEENLYGLADEIAKAFEVRGIFGWFDSVLLLDQHGTVAVIFGE